jgi:hypothetical protein
MLAHERSGTTDESNTLLDWRRDYASAFSAICHIALVTLHQGRLGDYRRGPTCSSADGQYTIDFEVAPVSLDTTLSTGTEKEWPS